MKLYKLLFTENDCFKAQRTIEPKGVMVHSTGANNPNLNRYVGPDDGRLGKSKYDNHWNKPGTGKCVHAFIGKLKDGSVATYQVLNWNARGWHCGGNANNTHISFEICEDGLTDAKYFDQVYREAVELTAYLCTEFKLDPLSPGVVICHSEGYKQKIASNHGDVMHWFPKHGKTMDDFRADVAKEMEADEMTEEQIRKIVRSEIEVIENERALRTASTWARAGVTAAKSKGFSDGSRPQSYATRQEVMVMLNSLSNKM